MDDEPSVPNDAQIGQDTPEADTPYEVGIQDPSACYEPEAAVEVSEAQRATEANGFCGALLYNAHLPGALELPSPVDQDIRFDEIGTFDVVRMDSVSTLAAFTLCTPFCPPGEAIVDGTGTFGNAAHEVFYDTGAQVGLTDDSETTNNKQKGDRRQWTFANIGFPNAAQFVQTQAGMWDMNGWTTPSTTYYFAAYLQDSQGDTISDEELAEMIGESDLDGHAPPTICGFSPDFNVTISGGSDAAVCELPFFYATDDGVTGEDGELSFDEYGDPCTSPTYTCNQLADGAYWRAYLPLHTTFNYLGTGEESVWGGNNYREWHFVVGPRAPTCSAQEPGFLTEADSIGAPYLAHDLDVYTPSTRLQATSTSPGPTLNYVDAVTAGPVETVLNSIPGLPGGVNQTLENVVSQANQTLDDANRQVDETQNETVGHTGKNARQEPNAAPGANPLSDTSKSQVSHSREGVLGDVCQRVLSIESEDTVDPWVDIIDAETSYYVTQTTLYGNDDPHQDDDNNPGPARFTTEGNVGLFADKNDDGDYDATGDQFTIDNINNAGAYPMIWDVRVNETGPSSAEITGDGSCNFGAQDHNLALEAKRLGYGPNTGLFQLIYLQEATVASVGVGSSDKAPYLGGNNIYLLASQSVKELWDRDMGESDTHPLEAQVDSAINKLQNWVVDNTAVETKPDVMTPGNEFGLESDFEDMCEASTGGFDSQLWFLHDCQSMTCEGDTIVTQFVFQAPSPGTFDTGGNQVIAFHEVNDITSDFGGFQPGLNVWTDVDPFDGDPDRNDDQTDRPPT